MAHDDGTTKKRTLLDSEIVNDTPVARRSALGAIGAVMLGAAAVAVGLEPSIAEAQSCTDSDPNDSAGRGRHCGGRRPPVSGRSGCTDSDPSDGGGNGRHCRRTGCTDSDGGARSDGAGFGRHCGRGAPTTTSPARPCTDSDPGTTADGVNRGRHCH